MFPINSNPVDTKHHETQCQTPVRFWWGLLFLLFEYGSRLSPSCVCRSLCYIVYQYKTYLCISEDIILCQIVSLLCEQGRHGKLLKTKTQLESQAIIPSLGWSFYHTGIYKGCWEKRDFGNKNSDDTVFPATNMLKCWYIFHLNSGTSLYDIREPRYKNYKTYNNERKKTGLYK